jgi:hypothetical protein
VFLQAAEQSRTPPPATRSIAILERGATTLERSFPVHLALVRFLIEGGLWRRAEERAVRAAELGPLDPEIRYLVGFCRMRQDRDREAIEALEQSLALGETIPARALLEQIRHSLATQEGMKEQRLSHFNVRYDGETHEAVGREVLRVLDRHYATLVQTFGHELETVVPVILYSNRSYYDATGAPAWSGGQYSHLDGRISLPIGGISGVLPADADGALLHELAHAFIHDMGGSSVPREIHEGLAQFVEGERCEGGRLSSQELAAVFTGRRNDVAAFYIGSLCFVEHLHRQRGQGGLNDLLLETRKTQSVDASFDRIYGRTFADSLGRWQADMHQRHGR